MPPSTTINAHRAVAVVMDISDEATVEAAFAKLASDGMSPDVVVANAGVQLFGQDAPAADLDLDVWRRTIDINLTGTFLTVKHAVRSMLARGAGGSIILTGSPTGLNGEGQGLHRLQRLEGRHPRPRPHGRRRVRRQGHPRQHGRAGIHRDVARHSDLLRPRGPRGDHRAHPARQAGQPRRRRGHHGVPGERRRRLRDRRAVRGGRGHDDAVRADAGGTDAGRSPGWWSPSRPWSSGDWSLGLRGDELADIRFRGRLVLRGVRAVVRDADWGTVPTRVVDAEAGASTLTVRLAMDGLGLSVEGTLTAAVRDDGLEIRWRAVSAHAAETNRAGIVLLHPPAVGGAPLTVRHPGGATTATAFPVDVSPHQPAFDIAGLDWTVEGVEARLSLSGDVFEMEDQRNWTDASFKTYSRPLSLPFPYSLAEGQVLVQTARLEATERDAGRTDAVPGAAGDRIDLVAAGAFPSVGLAASTAPDPAPGPASDAAHRPTADTGHAPAFVLVEIDLATPNWRAALARAARSGPPLDVRIVADPGDDLGGVVGALSGLRVARIGVYGHGDSLTSSPLHENLRAAAAAHDLAIPLVGGSRAHFTELNRGRDRIPQDLDALTFSVTPLFHTLDTEQLVESVAMQRLVAAQAAHGAADRPVHVGPVTLRPRFNNVATRPRPAPTAADLSAGYGAAFGGEDDPRIDAPELRAWTVASAAALAVPGVASVCYFEEWGPRGIHDSHGRPRPVAEGIGWLAALDGAALLAGDSPDGEVWAVGARHAGGTTVLAANIGRTQREIAVTTPAGGASLRLAPGEAVRVELDTR